MNYATPWKVWLSEKDQKRRKAARRWRKVRRTLSAACASYRRPYTRPALDANQRRAQLTISIRRPCATPASKNALDVFLAASNVAARAVTLAQQARQRAGPRPDDSGDRVREQPSRDVREHGDSGNG